jgi:hypothetical protein
MVENDETKLCFWLSIADIQHFVVLVVAHSPSFVGNPNAVMKDANIIQIVLQLVQHC